MDRNTIIGLVLIFGLIAGYSWWASPSAEEREQMQREQAEQRAIAQAQNTLDSLSQSVATEDQELNTAPVAVRDSLNVFGNASTGNAQKLRIETDVFTVNLQSQGGIIESVVLKDYLTHDQEALILFDKQFQDFYLEFFANNRKISTRDMYFEMILPKGASEVQLSGDQTYAMSMRLYPNDGDGFDKSRYLEFAYTFRGNEYMIDFQVNFVGMQEIITNRADFIDLHWNSDLPRNEKAPNLEDPNTGIYYKPINDKMDYLNETRDDQEEIKTPLKWIAFKHQFFSSILLMKESPMENADLSNYVDPAFSKEDYVKSMKALIGLPYKGEAKHSIDMQLYLGPNKFSTLKGYQQDFERLIPLGWNFFLTQWVNRVAVIPIFNFLEKMNLSYGLIILILTILLKLALAPLTFKSYMSSAKMRIIKPEVDALSAKFPKPEQAMDKQRAVMALYKKAGISQLAGCIPMLVQMPILIAMFRFFPSSIELRQESFLWADDLSSYDSIVNLPFNIPFYGNHVSLFALLMAVSNLFYTRMTMKQNSSATAMPGMKMMMYIMPIMFLGFLNSYSAALNYYYFLSTCMTFIITWGIGKMINEEKIHRQIQENKKKPVVKSKFQQRLDNMVKQQQTMQKRK